MPVYCLPTSFHTYTHNPTYPTDFPLPMQHYSQYRWWLRLISSVHHAMQDKKKCVIDPKGYMHPDVHCSTVYNSQDMEAT